MFKVSVWTFSPIKINFVRTNINGPVRRYGSCANAIITKPNVYVLYSTHARCHTLHMLNLGLQQ